MEENVLKFNVVVDSARLAELKGRTGEVFSGIRRELKSLTGFSEAELKNMVTSIQKVNVGFEVMAENIGRGATVGQLRQIAGELRAMEAADAKLTRANIANIRQRAQIETDSIKQVGAIRDREYKNYANTLSNQNKQIKENANAFLKLLSDVNGGGGGGGNSSGSSSGGGFFGGGGALGFLGKTVGFTLIHSAINAVIGSIRSLITETFNLGKAGVVAAAEYEQTVNALTVASGSARAARVELAAVDQIARNTTGLRLEQAEEGYTRLRNLGFGAKVAGDLLKGLAIQKLISRADESAINRVIVNLTQLSTGSVRASQDIKEIILAIPSLKGVFQDAFGTANAKLIGDLFKSNPDEAVRKFSEAMRNAEAPAGGLNDAIAKLSDAAIRAGREFGEPILDPLTDAAKGLTGLLDENSSMWRRWGQTVADAIQGANDVARGAKDLGKYLGLDTPDSEAGVIRRGLRSIGRGTNKAIALISNPGLTFLNDLGEQNRLREEALNGTSAQFRDRVNGLIPEETSNLQAQAQRVIGLNREAQSVLSSTTLSDDERTARMKVITTHLNEVRAAFNEFNSKQERMAENARVKRIADLKDGLAGELAAIKDSGEVEIATISSKLRLTKAEQLEGAREISAAKIRQFTAERDKVAEHYDQLIALNGDNEAEGIKLTREKGEKLAEINTKIKVEEINAAKEVAATELEILRERRAAQIAAGELAIRDAKSVAERQTTEVRRGLEKGNISAADGYERLREIATNEYRVTLAKTKAANALRLKDETLTAEQLANVREEGRQAELGLAEDFRQKMLNLDDDYYARQVANLKRNFSEMREVRSSQPELFSGLGSFFDSNKAVGKLDLGKISKAVNAKFDSLTAQRLTKNLALSAGNTLLSKVGVGTKEGSAIKDRLNETQEELAAIEEQLQSLNRVEFPPNLLKLEQLGNDMASGKVSGGFDKAAKMLLDIRHRFETADLEGEIGLTEELLKLAKTAGNGSEVLTLTRQLESLSNKRVTLGIKQQAESIAQYDDSLEGLNERISKLRSGDLETVLGVRDRVEKSVARERIGLLEGNIEGEYRLAHAGEDAAERYRKAWIDAMMAVKLASVDAKESQITSQIEIAQQTVFNADVARAGILKAMAGAKGYTEIFQDGFLAVSDAISSSLGSLIGKATDKLGAFGQALSNIATQLLTMVTNRLMMKLLDVILPAGRGVSGGASSGGGIGGILGGALGILTGRGSGGSMGIGIGGNPGFNPASLLGATGGFGLSLSSIRGASGFADTGAGALPGFGITADQTLTGQASAAAGATNAATSTGGGLLQSLLGGKISWGSIGKSLGAAAPLLGLSLGAGLGGNSITGSILGGVGGLLGGVGAGIATGAIGLGGTTGIIGSTLGAGGLGLGALAATGVLAAVAVPLLVGAFLLGRNKQRRADEVTRTQYITDAMKQLDEVLAGVKAHKFSSGDEAIKQAEGIRESYREAASSLKDKKTRNIALKEINDRINPKIEAIRAAAGVADADRARFDNLIPEFATGGIVPGQPGAPRLVLAHGGELIANLRQQTPELMNAAGQAGIPGVGNTSGAASGNGGNIVVHLVVGTEAQNEMFVNGAKSSKGYNVLNEQSTKLSKFDKRTTSF